MAGRGVKKRGRPPKSGNIDKNRKFQYHLLKKPKYLQSLNNASGSFGSTPSASRASSPLGSDVSRRSSRKHKVKKPNKSKRGGSSSFNSRRGYNPHAADYHESEYHYGSDFGDDFSDRSDPEEHGSESSEGSHADGAASDSDFSMSSCSSGGLAKKTHSGSVRPPSPDPLWLQQERPIPLLTLPPSSDDLIIHHEHVLQMLGIYEVLRRFRHLVRLSPFRIEDLCAALLCEDQSNLLIEIHMMLLKALLREEDAQQTHFGPLDHKDSVNVTLLLLDVMTWPEVLRIYVESDKSFDQTVVKVLNTCEYPFTSVENRLTVLQFLCNQFLITNPVRDDLLSEVPIHYDDHCRVCHRLGDLLCCETCPAVYHLDCVDPPLATVPSEDWQCALCKTHKLMGVTDCLSDAEKQGMLCRHEHLGFDRHGRKYWFIVRRIFIESENGEVWYYSTPEQLQELLDVLDSEDMEAPLVRELLEMKQEIVRQMDITEKLTNQAKGSRKSYLETENSNIIKQRELKKEQEQQNPEVFETMENKMDTENILTDGDVMNEVTVTSEDVSQEENDEQIIDNSNIEESKKNKNDSSKSKQIVLRKNDEANSKRMTRLKSSQMSKGTYLFKLGNENNFKTYVNQYTTNPLALNKPQRNEERDKKRYMSHKFSLSSGQEFKWVGLLNNTKPLMISTLRQTLLQFESNIIIQFMHTNWPLLKKPWMQAVQLCQAPRDFSRALCVLQACIKNAVWVPAWHEQLGHVKLWRTTASEREERKKIDKREKKEKDEEEERYRNSYNFVKYSLGLRHQVWKQKGEEYRIHGQWDWLWHSSTRKFRKSISNSKLSLLEGPAKYVVKVKKDDAIKLLAVEKRTYEYLISNNKSDPEILNKLPQSMHGLEVIEESENFDEIDVEKELSSSTRKYYPKIARKSKLDTLLKRRIQLQTIEEKSLENEFGGVKKEETDVKIEDDKNIDVENEDLNVTSVDSEPKENKNIDLLRNHYLELSQLASKHKCYFAGCKDIEHSKVNVKTKITNSCFSPLCINKIKTLNKLISLLQSDVPNNSIHDDTKEKLNMSLLEKCLSYKNVNLQYSSKTNILSDLLSAVACAQECSSEKVDKHVKRKSSDSIDTNISSQRDCDFPIKTESTLEESAIPAVGNEMDIDITSNANNESDVEIGPLKELTDGESENLVDVESDKTRPPIPKLRITRGRTAKMSLDKAKESDSYKCSLTETKADKPKYRAKFNRRFGINKPLKKEEKEVKEEKIEDGRVRVYSVQNPRGKIYLKKVHVSNIEKKKKRAVKYPLCSTYHTKTKAKSIMVLAKHELQKLSRQAGHFMVSGFSYSSKPNQTVWPYPCPRPSFKTCWLYRTVNLQWLASAALQLRVMWACLRWDDMSVKPATTDGKHQLTTDTEIVSLELLKHRHIGQFLENTQYLRRRVVIPLELPKTVREVTSIRSGLRKRKRAESPQNTEPQVSEEWVDEDKLELWEIRQYGDRTDRVTPVTRTSTGKLPSRANPQTPQSAADIKEKMEQQLKEQRAAHQQKRALESQDKSKGTSNNNTPKSTLTSLLTSNMPTPTGQKTVIGTRRIIMTKGADGTTRVISQPVPTTNTSKTNQTLTNNKSKQSNTGSPKDGPQKIQITRGPDGVMTIKGLLPGQQIVRSSDGKLNISMVGQPVSGQIIAAYPLQKNAENEKTTPKPQAEEKPTNIPKIVTQTAQVLAKGSQQIVQPNQQMVVQTPQVLVQAGARPSAIPQRMQTVLVQGQLVQRPATAVQTPTTPAMRPQPPRPTRPATQQILINNPVLVQQIASGKIQLATVNGQQVLIRPTGNNQAQIVAHISQSPTLTPIAQVATPAPALAPLQTQPPPLATSTPRPNLAPVPEPVLDNNQQLTEDQIMEKRLLIGQPPGTVIKTVTAQVMQTSSGPRIVLQGLHGYSLSATQLALVQNQVKQQLLKAQESGGKQGMLGPTKMYLAVQPVSSSPPPLAPTQRATPLQSQDNHPKTQALLNGEDEVAEANTNKEATPTRPEDIFDKNSKTDIINPSQIGTSNNKFILTPDYIQQTIKCALKQENLNPEIEEKLLQLQRYQEKQMKPEAAVEAEPKVITTSAESPSPPPRRRVTSRHDDDDDDWLETSPRKRNRGARAVSPEAAPAPPAAPLPPPRAYPAPAAHDDRRRALSAHSRRQMLLLKTAELLKKDINKKRGLLEKELSVEIQRELAAELALRTRAERTKQEEVRSANKRRAHAPPAPAAAHAAAHKRSAKKEKLLCVCRTPYDETKFYVGCEHCSNWFHGDCVGISEEMSKTMEEYVCTECRRAEETQELYCLCRQPYDNSQFYICCDRCQDWFHGRCVGILQSEADNIDEYICPNCQKNNSVNYANMKELTSKDFENLKRLVKQIQIHKSAWPFMEPVDEREAPAYYKIIKEPMDLQTVERKVSEQSYSTLSDFIGDMTKIFDNCRYFNPKESEFYRCADSLEAFFAHKIKYFREKLFETTQ